jgi:hypothetical protein
MSIAGFVIKQVDVDGVCTDIIVTLCLGES